MPCIALPPFPPLPPLPPGISLPLFPGVSLPSLGLCCKIQIPPFPIGLPPIAVGVQLPPAVVAAYNAAVDELTTLYDAIGIPCPTD